RRKAIARKDDVAFFWRERQRFGGRFPVIPGENTPAKEDVSRFANRLQKNPMAVAADQFHWNRAPCEDAVAVAGVTPVTIEHFASQHGADCRRAGSVDVAHL